MLLPSYSLNQELQIVVYYNAKFDIELYMKLFFKNVGKKEINLRKYNMRWIIIACLQGKQFFNEVDTDGPKVDFLAEL